MISSAASDAATDFLNFVRGRRFATILADPADLERVVLNLAMNARDAMPRGGKFFIRCTVHSETHHRGEDPLRNEKVLSISATDTGEGMDEYTARHCLDPFFSTKSDSHGTGLGLFAVQAIVTKAGGRLTLDSAAGRGTTFTMWFPVYEAERVAAR